MVRLGVGVNVRVGQGVGSSGGNDVCNCSMSDTSMFGGIWVKRSSSCFSSSSASASATRCMSTCLALGAAFGSLLDCSDGSSVGEGFQCDGGCDLGHGWALRLRSHLRFQVRILVPWRARQKKASVFQIPALLAWLIKSIRVLYFATMAVTYFVAFCFCSSPDISFTGILELDKIDVAKAQIALQIACERRNGYDERPKWVENGI